MTGNTSPLGFPYLEDSDPLEQLPTVLQDLAEALDDYLAALAIAAGGQWTTWTPTITAGSGSFTTVSASGAYLDDGRTVKYHVAITITTVGTAAGGVDFTMPSGITIHSDHSHIGGGRESSVTGHELTVTRSSSTKGSVVKYDNSSIIGAGRALQLSGWFRKA